MLQFDATAVAALLDRTALIDALDAAFRAPFSAPERQHLPLPGAVAGQPDNVLMIMPAWNASAGIGVKLLTLFPGNSALNLPTIGGSYLLYDGTTGRPRALLDAGELTARRTAAASALAARHLSSPGASRLLMVGTGRLAAHLIASHALVRPIREVRVWGRNPARAKAVAAGFADGDLAVHASCDLESDARWADVISCATNAREPLVQGRWLRAGQHLDLVGAYTPAMRETDDEAIARAELFVDTRAGALHEAGEITGAIARGVIPAAAIKAELAELGSGRFSRSSAAAITVFKSVGAALEDLVAADLVCRASQAGDAPPRR